MFSSFRILFYSYSFLYSRMDKRITMLRVNTLEASFTFGRRLKTACRLQSLDGIVDPISMSIVEATDRFNLSTVGALCLTCLRYSDLFKIDWCRYVEGNSISVVQGKTETRFIIKPLASDVTACFGPNSVPAVPFPASYSSVRYALNNVLPRFVRDILTDSFSVTHVFRHLRASYLFAKSMPKDYISSLLGHRSKDAVEYYIHPDLVEIFKEQF
jgi:integrase